MRILVGISYVLLSLMSFGQGHDNWIARIESVDDAKRYASKHRDVSLSFVNMEKDRFLFDDIDTANMHSHVGQSTTLFGRTTKFLKDTSLLMVDLYVIELDPAKSSQEAVEALAQQILKKLRDGENYWDLKKSYSHTSTDFSSGPETVDEVLSKYGVDLHTSVAGSIYEYTRGGKKGLIILNVPAHAVPAFYAISFNSFN